MPLLFPGGSLQLSPALHGLPFPQQRCPLPPQGRQALTLVPPSVAAVPRQDKVDWHWFVPPPWQQSWFMAPQVRQNPPLQRVPLAVQN
jgi:hypothetical protein